MTHTLEELERVATEPAAYFKSRILAAFLALERRHPPVIPGGRWFTAQSIAEEMCHPTVSSVRRWLRDLPWVEEQKFGRSKLYRRSTTRDLE